MLSINNLCKLRVERNPRTRRKSFCPIGIALTTIGNDLSTIGDMGIFRGNYRGMQKRKSNGPKSNPR
jgi:hypothetical protein